MDRISRMTCPSLSREQINDLWEKAEMIKLMDLVMPDNKSKVMSAAMLTLADYEALKDGVIQIILTPPIFSSNLCMGSAAYCTPRSTGIKGLDKLLDGGLCGSEILEIYGDVGTGKTQMCFTVSSQILKSEGTVAYFDLKSNFSATRLLQCCGSGQEARESLRNIKVIRPCNLVQVVEDVEEIRCKTAHKKDDFWAKLKLIIFDSVPMIIYPVIDENIVSWRHYQERIIECILKLSKLNDGIAVIFVNHSVTQRSYGLTTKRIRGIIDQRNFTTKAALGSSYWGHKPNFRLLLLKNPKIQGEYSATLRKSTRTKCGQQFSYAIETLGIKSF